MYSLNKDLFSTYWAPYYCSKGSDRVRKQADTFHEGNLKRDCDREGTTYAKKGKTFPLQR